MILVKRKIFPLQAITDHVPTSMERGLLKWPKVGGWNLLKSMQCLQKVETEMKPSIPDSNQLATVWSYFWLTFEEACEKWKKTQIDFSVSFDVSLPDRSIHSSIQLRACLSSGVKVANGIRTQQTKLSPQPKLEVFSSGNFRLNESLRKVKFLDGGKTWKKTDSVNIKHIDVGVYSSPINSGKWRFNKVRWY